MRPVSFDELLPREHFIQARPAMVQTLVRVKANRRVMLGDHLTLLFENRETVRWQVQEMCRVENIVKPEAMQSELDAYNPLLPGVNELSATLLIEYPEANERKEMLVRLSGLHNHLRLELHGVAPCPAQFEDGREREDGKLSSVQFIRFSLSPEQRVAFLDLTRPARFVVDHPVYSAVTALDGGQRGAMIEDLLAD
jgi:hypothetical protein